jgi:hypothetical protein
MSLKTLFIPFAKLISMLVCIFCSLQVSAQWTCATATNLTAAGSFVSGVLTGNGASQQDAISARWYKFTPSINGNLNIGSCGGGADTRLWVWSGTCGNLQLAAASDDAAGCLSTGVNEYASQLQNLILLAGNTYYFEWDNRWESSSFNWSFTFGALPANNDAGIVSVANPYTRIPISQAQFGILLGARIKNYSASSLSSVSLKVELFELPNTSTPIATFTSNPQVLPVGAELDFSAGNWSPVLNVSKTYQVKYSKIQPQLDAVGSNDQQIQTLVLDYNYFARDNGTYASAYNWSSTTDYCQGSRFTLNGPDDLTGLRYYLQSNSTSQVYHIQLYNIQNGVIDTSPFWESVPILANGSGWKNYNLPTALSLASGSYVIAIYKSGPTPFPVGCSTGTFAKNASFIRVGAGSWNSIESYSLNYVFMLRPKFGQEPPVDVAILDHQNPGVNYTENSTRQQPNGTPLLFSARIQNNGVSTATNVSLQVVVKNALQQVVYTANSPTVTLGSNQIDTLTLPSYVIEQVGGYTIEYEVLCPQDAQLINNLVSTSFARTTNRLSKHVGISGEVGIGNNISAAYDNGIIGQTFALSNPDVLDSIRITLRPGTPANQPVRLEIYATNAQGVPIGSAIAQTLTHTTTTANSLNGVTLSLGVVGGSLNLTPGTYFIGVLENAGNIRLGASSLYYQAGTTFKRWNQNPYGATSWTPFEQFNQFVALAISPIFKPCLPLSIAAQVTQASCGQNNGAILLTPTGFSGQINFTWSPSASNTNVLSSLPVGAYSCVLQDENACQMPYSTTIAMTSQSPSLSLVSQQNVLCYGQSTGSLSLAVTGGLSPYTYQWTGTTQLGPVLQNLAAGSYTLQVRDANNCNVIQTFSIAHPFEQLYFYVLYFLE